MEAKRDSAIAAAVITVIGGIIAAFIARGSDGDSSGSSSTSDASVVTVTFPSTPDPDEVVEPSGPASLFVNRDSGPGGSTVLLSGEGFEPGERVVFRFHTDEVGSTTASSTGAFANVSVTVPSSYGTFAPQQFTFTATGSSSIRSASAPFTITG